MSKWTDQAKWIWIDNYDDTLPDGQVVLFRKTFYLDKRPTDPCIVRVSADTRYRLFVNGMSVSFGPCKSYPSRWYYETVDINPYLGQGSNTLHARVLRFTDRHPGSLSMMRGPYPGFLLHCVIDELAIHTDPSWEGKKDASVTMVPRSEWNYALGPPFMALNERIDGSLTDCDWHVSNADSWTSTKIMTAKSMMLPVLEPWKLTKRSIPTLPEVEKSFHSAVTCSGPIVLSNWNSFLDRRSILQVPSYTTVAVDLQVLELTTGFLVLQCLAGPGASIRILCSESYEQPMECSGPGAKRFKSDRTDHLRGKLYGAYDYYRTRRGLNVFEPFWFRTFRYVQLEITTGQDPLTLNSFLYRETRYPLEVQSTLTASDELQKMWKISLNTLRNCMHETYEDCPYYEQNQFIADARLQILFTYQISRDDRLARKTIHEFYASRRDDGLLQAQFPSPGRTVNIPQFSLFWVLMVYDHMMYFGDRRLVKQYISAVDGILDHFDARINGMGLVGQFDEEYWPFVDWVREWHGSTGLHSMGIPNAYWKGAATYNSLVYAYVLSHAADLCDFLGRHDTGNQYRERAKLLNAAVNRHCFDGSMYLDGPGSDARSQHPQIFAALSGAIDGEAASNLLRRTLDDTTLPRCSYALGFYVLRAAAKLGLYQDMFPHLVEPWRKMMAEKLTTWAEGDVMSRSDCHGWSASPLHEIVAQLFGLTPAQPGYKSMRLEPLTHLLSPSAKGTFVTAEGIVTISWTEGHALIITATFEAKIDFVWKGSRESHVLQIDEPLYLLRKDELPQIEATPSETSLSDVSASDSGSSIQITAPEAPSSAGSSSILDHAYSDALPALKPDIEAC